MNNFLAHNNETRQGMLNELGCNSVEALFSKIPNFIKEFKLANPLSELETQRQIKAISKKDNTDLVSFLGAGVLLATELDFIFEVLNNLFANVTQPS